MSNYIIFYFSNIEKTMAKLWSNAVQDTEQVENPIKIFLENVKWQLWIWNKEKKQNDFHTLDKFLVLNIWYTIKWQVWDDSIKKYTATYYSNEISSFNETFYAIEMTFWADKKTYKKLISKWVWQLDKQAKIGVKFDVPTGIGLKVGIIVLDLNDWLVKEFFVWISDYINNIQQELKNATPSTVWGYELGHRYTNWTKVDDKEVFITEAELDSMKWWRTGSYENVYLNEYLPTFRISKEENQPGQTN